MICNLAVFSRILSSFLLKKFVRNMSTNIDVLISNQPLINNENKESRKRSPSEELVKEDLKQIKTEKIDRVKRKNCAILMGYLGINYYGMQRNKGFATIEEELCKALLKADLITEEAFDYMQSIHFQRAARTDKFVSAAGQIVNLKLPNDPSKDLINSFLPDDIRIFSIKRVTKGFNSKNMCDARTYSYTIPTYAFATELIKYDNISDIELEKRIEDLSLINGKPFNEYRISQEKMDKLSNILKKFEGSHNFHNFTSKILPLDPRAQRYIISFICSEPFIKNDLEFVTLEVKGQSFMLHQIRKMIGTVIGILREVTTEEVFDRCFNEIKIDLPRAPGLGLVLKTVHMDYYNKRYGNDGVHETLDWFECKEELESFFKDNILKYIVETEVREKNMLTWLANIPFHKFDVRNQINEEVPKEEELKDDLT